MHAYLHTYICNGIPINDIRYLQASMYIYIICVCTCVRMCFHVLYCMQIARWGPHKVRPVAFRGAGCNPESCWQRHLRDALEWRGIDHGWEGQCRGDFCVFLSPRSVLQPLFKAKYELIFNKLHRTEASFNEDWIHSWGQKGNPHHQTVGWPSLQQKPPYGSRKRSRLVILYVFDGALPVQGGAPPAPSYKLPMNKFDITTTHPTMIGIVWYRT